MKDFFFLNVDAPIALFRGWPSAWGVQLGVRAAAKRPPSQTPCPTAPSIALVGALRQRRCSAFTLVLRAMVNPFTTGLGMAAGRRVERVAGADRRDVSELLVMGLKDERIALRHGQRHHEWRWTGDLQHWQKFREHLRSEDDRQEALAGLKSATPFVAKGNWAASLQAAARHSP